MGGIEGSSVAARAGVFERAQGVSPKTQIGWGYLIGGDEKSILTNPFHTGWLLTSKKSFQLTRIIHEERSILACPLIPQHFFKMPQIRPV